LRHSLRNFLKVECHVFKTFASISLVIFGLTLPTIVAAEDKAADEPKIGNHDKGSWYAFWGWNRGFYSNSDVHFKGDNYDFTIKGMTASDRPTTIGIDPYLNPLDMTLPQTNFKVGYFFKDNYAISFGVDHMKYIMDQEQTAILDGYVNVGSEHDGEYDNAAFSLAQYAEYDEDGDFAETGEYADITFLSFEHSDGLNYVNVEISHFDELYAFTPNIQVSRIFGVGVGFMLPKTNAKLLGNERHDAFHLAGWGTHLKGGLELNYKSFFIRSEIKTGYIDMPDIRTTEFRADSAEQHFTFTEWNFLIGSYF